MTTRKSYRFPIPNNLNVVEAIQMNKTSVIIMGISIGIRYTIHDPAYVEWELEKSDSDDDALELLTVLLRTHYSGFIEAACRESAYYLSYAAHAMSYADDWADSLNYTKGIQDVFKDEDIPF